MKQLDMFVLADYNPKKYSLAKLDCHGDKSKLAKKNKAIKKGFEVGKKVLIDNTEYEISRFCFNGDGDLLCCLRNSTCIHIAWNFNSSRLTVKEGETNE